MLDVPKIMLFPELEIALDDFVSGQRLIEWV